MYDGADQEQFNDDCDDDCDKENDAGVLMSNRGREGAVT